MTTTTTDPVTETFGYLTVITWKDADGISINVFAAGTRNSTLSATYPHADREGAKGWYRAIRAAAKPGVPVWQIEGEVKERTTFRPADDAERALIDGILTGWDEDTKHDVAEVQQTVETVEQVMAEGESWTQFRQSLQQRAAVTSEPMDRVLASADGRGYILRGQDATSTQLVALKRRGLVELDWRTEGRTRRIAGAWLARTGTEKAA